jgi:hypothetical protein
MSVIRATGTETRNACLLRITQLLHEDRMLLDTRDVERLRLGADSIDEIVVRDGSRRDISFDSGCIGESDRLRIWLRGMIRARDMTRRLVRIRRLLVLQPQ